MHETPGYDQQREPGIVEESIIVGSEAIKKAPAIKGVETGVEGVDELFFIVEGRKGEFRKKPLGGIPEYSVLNITGVSDTGKSIFVEQFAVRQASLGYPVAFVTVESPANFTAKSLEVRANAMGIDFKEISERIILIDAASYSTLRENTPDLLATLAYAIRNYRVKRVVIDSVTGLFENREMQARTVVRRLFNFMKKWGQTALFVSQKRSGHEELTAEAAGGYAVGHIVDGTIVFAKELVNSASKAKLYGCTIGETVRLFRIDGCRLCGHDTKTRLMEITDEGLIRVLSPIGSF